MSSANSYSSTSTQHMCDMDRCVLRTSLSLRNFGRRFYGCHHWSPDFDQACKFFRWLDKDTCPRGHATAPIVWERFTRLAAEAEAAKNERDNARRMETEALERERLAKRRAEKYRVAVRTAEEKVHKFRIALITSWVMIWLYFVVTPMFGGNGQMKMCLP